MVHEYCYAFGFNEDRLKIRLTLLGLTEADLALGELLHEQVILPNVDRIIDRFYVFLLKHDQFSRFLGSDEIINSLKQTQKDYLLDLGVSFDTLDYFEKRLRIGRVHYRVGLPLHMYQCAYRLMQQLIIECIPQDANNSRELINFVLKATSLDMSLATEAYHLTRVRDLEDSLDTLRHEEDELRMRARTDDLTGLYNRVRIVELLEQRLGDAQANGKALCVIMVDLDRFKHVNDTHGHLVGDQVLQDVAARMTMAYRNSDIIGRYGGEEFIIILSDTGADIAMEIAERVRHRVGDTPVIIDDLEIGMTISQGLAQATAGDNSQTLLERADKALYRAKENGRNRVELSGM